MPAKTIYVPERGDLVWLNFTPQSGHEQAGHRPALTISPQAYNAKVGLAIFCPITSQIKGYPFEVKLKLNGKSSVILSDQIKNLDWRERKASFIAKADTKIIKETLQKIALLTGIDG